MARRRFKDRKDARRIDIQGISQLIMDLKPERCDSDVYINQKIDVTNLVKYMDTLKDRKDKITYFHAFLTAIAKAIYNRPKLNRFVANRHIYEHNEIIISFVAKLTFDDKSDEVMLLIPIDDNDNIFSISKKTQDKVKAMRESEVSKEGANSAVDTLGKLPNIIRVPVVGFLKWLDKKGKLPSSLVKDNLYYSSMIVSNLGSIKCGAIYHNITNFGSCSSLATMGEIKDELVIKDGKEEIRKICEFGINLDERIADGYYFAKSINLLQYIINNPKILEEEMKKTIDVKEVR